MGEEQQKTASIWKNKTFIQLFIAYSIATIGSFFDMMAVILLFSYVWYAEPWVIALVPVAYALPHALISQFIGIFVDKYNKIYIMLFADIITVCFTLVLVIIESPWLALFILLLRGAVSTVHFPSQQAIIRKIVNEEHLLKAVTIGGAVNQFSKIIAPFIGVTIATIFSPKASFFIYVIALMISIAILYPLRHVDKSGDTFEKTVVQTEKASFMRSWKEGWKVLFQSKIFFASFLFVLIALSALQLVDVQFTVLFRQVYPDNPNVIGWAISSIGAGAIISMFFLNRLKDIKKYGVFLSCSVFIVGFGIGLISLLQKGSHFIWPIIFAFFIGVGTGLFSGVHSYILQKESPDGKVGQMSGMYNSLSGFVILTAPIIGGILVQNFGVFNVFQYVGIVIIIIALIGLLFQKRLWHREKTAANVTTTEVEVNH